MWGGTGQGRDGAGLKSCPIPALQPLWGMKNLSRAKQGGAGQAGWGKIVVPTRMHTYTYEIIFEDKC